MSYPAKSLTKPMISPDWNSGNIYLYTPSTIAATDQTAVVNPRYTVNIEQILTANSALLDGAAGASPNVCALYGDSLFFTNNNTDTGPQAVFGFPGYLNNPDVTNAFVLDLNGNGYQGLALDPSGNLYVCILQYTGSNPGWNIVRYAGGGAATGLMRGEGTPLILAGDTLSGTADYGNLAFDSAGNLWATDYGNDRLVVIAAAALSNPGNVSAWAALANTSSGAAGSFKVANTVAGLNTNAAFLLASPEGLDFAGFGGSGSLWVANNNDGGDSLGQQNVQNGTGTSVVEITAHLQSSLVTQANLNNPAAATIYATSRTAGTDYNIYQVPNYTGVLPQFGGLQVDRATGRLYVNDEVGGWVRGYDITALAATPNKTSDTDSQIAPITLSGSTPMGNGGIALVQLGCFMQDDNTDAGDEPDNIVAPNVAWESPAIVASIDPGPGPLAALPTPAVDASAGLDGSDTIEGGVTRYLYVQVNYTGAMPTTGLEQLRLYWAKGSATLQWPNPWDGSTPADPAMGLAVGGPVIDLATGQPAAITIPSVVGTPFGQTPPPFIAGPVAWAAPNPADYSGVDDGHFCLLARIVTPNTYYAENTSSDSSLPTDNSIDNFAGMTAPEFSTLGYNVMQNARIAWRNIHILTAAQAAALGETSTGPYIKLPPGVVATNFGREPLHLRFGFDLLDGDRRIIREPAGRLLISAAGRSLALLESASLGRFSHDDARRPSYRCGVVPHVAAGIERLRLEPGETLVFHVDYEPPAGLHNYAIRASAFSGKQLIGGQTFVYGAVKGLSKA